MSTIGLDFRTTKVKVDDKVVPLQLWDTAGQERFLSITRAYIRGAAGIILVYDITKPSSFSNCQMWLQTIKDYADDSVTVFLVGNKTDMASDRAVSESVAKAFAEERSIDHFEVSAKDGTGVREMFYSVASKLSKKMSTQQEEPSNTVMVPQTNSSSKCSCG
ncbi:hypothetical protein GEMRC1_003630 [Eukaryota sp. GEM-RC1]